MAETAARLKKAEQILVIEDAGTLLSLLDHVLRLQGYQVVSTDDPMNAFELALQLQPELVLLDVCMPGLDGFSLARILRAHPKTADIRIVFLAGRCTADDMTRAKELRADAYVDKPFRMEAFLTLVREVLERAKPPKQT